MLIDVLAEVHAARDGRVSGSVRRIGRGLGDLGTRLSSLEGRVVEAAARFDAAKCAADGVIGGLEGRVGRLVEMVDENKKLVEYSSFDTKHLF